MSATTLTADEIQRLKAAGLTPISATTDGKMWAFEVRPSPEWLKCITGVDGFRIAYEGGEFIAYRK